MKRAQKYTKTNEIGDILPRVFDLKTLSVEDNPSITHENIKRYWRLLIDTSVLIESNPFDSLINLVK